MTGMIDASVMDALQLQVWTAGSDGQLSFVNRFAADYFGRSAADLVGEGWQNVIHSSDLDRAVETWTHSVTTGDPYDVQFRLLRASDRTYRWHHASARLVSDVEGAIWIGSNIDIDGEMRAAEVVEAMRAQLRR